MSLNKFRRLQAMDLERALFSAGFLMSVAITFASFYYCAAADIHAKSTITYLFSYAMKNSNIFSFLILASTFAYSASFCVDRSSGAIRPIVARSGKRAYAVSKCVACSLSGGLAIAIGAMLFLAYLGVLGLGLLPSVGEINAEYSWQAFGELLLGPSSWLYFACLITVLFIQSAFWSCLGLCVSAYLPSQYIAISSPYILSFVFLQIANMLKLPVWLNPVKLGIASQAIGNFAETLLVTLGVFAALIIVCSMLFIRRVERRISND